jgi:hypothetical protein
MKFLTKILALIFIFSIVTSSAKRRRTRLDNYSGSELDAYIGQIAYHMCLHNGRDATYVFFGRIGSYINKTLTPKHRPIYDAIFGPTFDSAIRSNKIDQSKIAREIMTTVEAKLGGNSPLQKPAYWKNYSDNMYQQNQQYLDGLNAAAQGTFEKLKNYNDMADVAGKVVENGFSAYKEIISDAMGGGAATMVTEAVLQGVVGLIQLRMLKNAHNSAQLAESERRLGQRVKKVESGECGKGLNVNDDPDGLPAPYFDGNLDIVIRQGRGKRRRRF